MPAPITRIYLTGFMGAGKTTVGRILADRLGWSFHDIDTVIEREQQTSVARLFALQGEHAFRTIEHATIRRMHASEQAVISLGGGALETEDTRTLIHTAPGACLVFLDAPLPLLINRCLAQDGGQSRPVLRDRAHLESRYDFRLAFYKNAHLTVATQSLTPEEVAASILDRMAAQPHGNLSAPARS